MEAINVANLESAFAHLVPMGATVIVAEHAVRKDFREGWRRKARAPGFQLHLSPTDPEA